MDEPPPGMTTGSSPHTRGARCWGCRTGRSPRIIPAYAGSTNFKIFCLNQNKDHPRIRGEHGRVVFLAADVVGSSPHTRGARRQIADGADRHGIIPAYAGSTPPPHGRP